MKDFRIKLVKQRRAKILAAAYSVGREKLPVDKRALDDNNETDEELYGVEGVNL